MNVEIGSETPIFLFWEYLFRNFGILSLQCTHNTTNIESDLVRLNKAAESYSSEDTHFKQALPHYRWLY
jgi:hypothetical protein